MKSHKEIEGLPLRLNMFFHKYSTLTTLLLIIILGFGIYGKSLKGDFIWDDMRLVRDNVYIRSWVFLPRIFTNDMGRGAGITYTYYRPIPVLTFMLGYHLWGLEVMGYHLTSVLIHVLVSISLFYFVKLIFRDKILAFLSGIIFVTHPAHTEVVMWISARQDSLAFLFMLQCFIFYVRSLEKKGTGNCILMLVSFVLALLSKEYCLMLPVLVLVYHYVFRQKLDLKVFLGIVAVSAVYVWARLVFLVPWRLSPAPTTLIQRLPGMFAAITGYIKLMIFPVSLHADYGNPLFGFGHPAVIGGVIITVLFLGYAFKNRDNDKVALFSILWFFVTLAPVSNIYPMVFYMAERWFYVPSAGFCILMAVLLRRLYRREKLKVLATGLISGLIIFYSFFTLRQGKYWDNQVDFYKRIIQFEPDNHRAYNNLGNAYRQKGMAGETIASYKKSLQIEPSSARTYANLGFVYLHEGNYEMAQEMFEITMKLEPSSAEPYNNMGLLFLVRGKEEEAIAMFNKAIETDPRYKEPYYNLGRFYRRKGDADRAIDFYKKVLEIDPYYAPAHNSLAVLYYYKKEIALAIRHCDRALELGYKVHPEFLEILKYLKQ